ncbi:MAG TPA: amidohydrolase [Verrucomicrobiales bacterium]|nr:amidohydrolase [Verrucomicrobiales bacterium]
MSPEWVNLRVVTSVCGLLLVNCMRAPAQEADLIVHHGNVVTVDEAFTIAQAMAVKDGVILRVGTSAEALELKGPSTELLNLDGKMVLPGLIDSHTHPVSAAMTEFDHEIPPMDRIADVLAYVQGRAETQPAGEWIVLQQVFITRLREQRYPTRAELDAVAPQHPVVFRTGPDASFNSLALKLTGVDRDFRIPSGTPGRIERDARGEPTGILRNFSNYVKLPAAGGSAPAPGAQKLERLKLLLKDYNANGITAIADRNASPESVVLYRKLRADGDLSVRVAISHQIDAGGPVAEVQNSIRQVALHVLFREKDPLLRIIGIKTFLDGGMLTGSAYMRAPWGVSDIYAITDPGYRGVLLIPEEKLRPIVETAVESGLQFTAHSVGDGAVHALLDVYEDLARTHSIRETRPCLTHANFMSLEAVRQIARLGVVVDMQPAWLWLDTRTLLKHFGAERMRWFQPLKSLMESGAIIGSGSDHMQKIGALRAVNPYDPFLGMWVAITRRPKDSDDALYPEEALTREQAIRFYTSNNAWLTFRETDTGSLAPGKLADFIVLDNDLLSCPIEAIPRTKVLRTYLGGKLVYSRESDP